MTTTLASVSEGADLVVLRGGPAVPVQLLKFMWESKSTRLLEVKSFLDLANQVFPIHQG